MEVCKMKLGGGEFTKIGGGELKNGGGELK